MTCSQLVAPSVLTKTAVMMTFERQAVLRRLYASMLRIRTVEEGLAAHYAEQEMRCPVHLCTGQEAVTAAATLPLQTRDYVLSGHRSHGHYLGKGGNLKRMIAEIYGRATGCAGGIGGSMHLVDLEVGFLGAAPIVGSTIPIAVGAAFGTQLRGEDRVTMVFFGDGATEAGVLHESLNFASLKHLPVVFVCENNLYSVYSPLEVRQPEGRAIADLARAHQVRTHAADGNDAEAAFELCADAVEYARSGNGPVFLEFATYRWREHCGPNFDNSIGYRTEAEYLEWRQRDPLQNLHDRLVGEGVAAETELEQLAQSLQADFDEAIEFAKNSPFPDATAMDAHVYAEPARTTLRAAA